MSWLGVGVLQPGALLADRAARRVVHAHPDRARVQRGQAVLRGRQRVQHRPREQPVEQQELGDQGRLGGPAVGADEGLVRAAGAQQQRPAWSGGPGIRASSSRAVMSARSSERPSTRNRQASSWLMVESARPKNSADALPDEPQEHVRAEPLRGAALAGERRGRDVQALPHLAGDHLADAARAGPRREHRAGDGARALRVVGQPEQRGADVEPVILRLDPEEAEQRAAVRAGSGPLDPGIAEQPVHVDVDEPRGVVGALDVPAGPEQGLGDPAEQVAGHVQLIRAALPGDGEFVSAGAAASSGRAAAGSSGAAPLAAR